MGDPAGAAHVRRSLRSDGAWMIVEPFANDRLEDNLNPIGRIFYSASTIICTPASRSQEVGARARRAGRGEAACAASSPQRASAVRRATETPFNLVLEARP